MIFTQNMITEMLLNLKGDLREQKIMGKSKETTAFLEHCLNQLEDYESDLLKSTTMEKVSIRKYAKISGFSRSFVTKQRQLLIAQLTKIFNIKFSFDQNPKGKQQISM